MGESYTSLTAKQSSRAGPRFDPSSFYEDEPAEVPEISRTILEKYSHVPSDSVVKHVVDVRNSAWSKAPYPCMGLYSFLDIPIAKHPLYTSTILPLLKSDRTARFLDLGCGLGQDSRKVLYDGVAAEQVYASDLNQEFIDLGFQLFQDDQKLSTELEKTGSSTKEHFTTADVFDESPESPMRRWQGMFDVINASALFHLFTEEQQKVIAKQVVNLLKDKVGTLIIGWQLGFADEQNQKRVWDAHNHFQHYPGSWKAMWEEIGTQTSTRWGVDVSVRELLKQHPFWDRLRRNGTKVLAFSVRRVG